MGILTYHGNKFYLDGKPFTVISGAMHYFRIPREYWYDRLLKLKECGFNTVETYTCWNLHEPSEGKFDFSGNLDIEAYIKMADELGLNMILRPGPYICAEWEFGGLPAWILNYEGMPLRCYDEGFMKLLRRYYTELLRRVKPHLAINGGNIFMLQIENEYGSYGDDKRYLRAIEDIYRECGVDCLFFTSDNPLRSKFARGSLPEHLATANFGSAPKRQFTALRELYPERPLMCTEFWSGWFDHWGGEHHVRPAEEIVGCVKEFAELGASFNFYMFHGGTNFGFTNGANYDDKYTPTITSYDYNAPLTEAGDRTDTYYKIREILNNSYGNVPKITAKETKKCAYGKFKLTKSAYLFDNLDKISSRIAVAAPKYMEEIGQSFGYTLYRTSITGPIDGDVLYAEHVHDRAHVFINGKLSAIWERWNMDKMKNEPIVISLDTEERADVDILVENMGRVNFGAKLRDRKGINGVHFGEQLHFGWDMYPLTMRELSGLEYKDIAGECKYPAFLCGNLKIDGEPCDTFIKLDGFTKGFVTVNGHNIGRYYNTAGPQRTLYIPAPFLRCGDNEITVFESDCTSSLEVEFVDKPELG